MINRLVCIPFGCLFNKCLYCSLVGVCVYFSCILLQVALARNKQLSSCGEEGSVNAGVRILPGGAVCVCVYLGHLIQIIKEFIYYSNNSPSAGEHSSLYPPPSSPAGEHLGAGEHLVNVTQRTVSPIIVHPQLHVHGVQGHGEPEVA